MAETAPAPLRRSPLDHLRSHLGGAGGTDVRLREVPFLQMVSLRAVPTGPVARRWARLLDADLPVSCGVVGASATHSALWLGPDEWLLVGEQDVDLPLAALEHALGRDHGAVVDVSANRTTLELSGPAARSVLEKGCALDLHPRTFPAGSAVATLLGPVPVVLWCMDDGPRFRLLPRSSFADYVARWLLDAMSEYADPEAGSWP